MRRRESWFLILSWVLGGALGAAAGLWLLRRFAGKGREEFWREITRLGRAAWQLWSQLSKEVKKK